MPKIFKQIVSVAVIALALFVLLVAITRGQVQQNDFAASGGPYVLEKAVVAGGGRAKDGQPVGENGTAGQAVAGHRSQGGSYVIQSGFWTPDPLAPTAAGATITGRVSVGGTQGIRNAVLELVSGNGATRRTITGPFGYFTFIDVPVGEVYLLTVKTKRFAFDQQTRLISLSDDIADMDFLGVPR